MQRDTNPEAAAIRLAALRELDGEARLAQALEMSEAVRELAEAGRRARESEAMSGFRTAGGGEPT